MFRSESDSGLVLQNEADCFIGLSNDYLQRYSITSLTNTSDGLHLSTSSDILELNSNNYKAGASTTEEYFTGNSVDLPTISPLQTFHSKDPDYTILEGTLESQPRRNSSPITNSTPQKLNISLSEDCETPKLTSPISTSRIKDSKEYSKGLIPKIHEVNPQNYSILLLETLRDWLYDIQLDEFYNLLYNYNIFDECPTGVNLKMSTKKASNKKGFEICSLIVETFRLPHKGTNADSMGFRQQGSLSLVNYEEFLKTFLALKIIFDLIEEVDLPVKTDTSIPRRDIYNAYYIICQKLAERHQKDSKLFKLHSKSIVGNAQLGRLIKLVFPRIKVRRLGRRGNSIHHYLGIAWNKSKLDPEMLSHILDDSKVPDLSSQNFSPTKTISKEIIIDLNEDIPRTPYNGMMDTTLSYKGMSKSLYSFVHISSKLPEPDCLPRLWDFVPGKIPTQSCWSQKIMSKSVSALEKYDVEIKPLIENLHSNIFLPGGLNNFHENFVQKVNVLINGNSDREGYMHFYLVILLVLFPIIISSDEEVPLTEKKTLQKNLSWFIERLNSAIPNLPNQERGYFMNFSKILKKMVNLNELTLSQIKADLTQGIAREMAVDFQRKATTEFNICETSVTDDIFSRAVIVSSKAFPSAFPIENTPDSSSNRKYLIMNIIKAYVKCAVIGTENILQLSNSTISPNSKKKTCDLPFRFFKSLAQLFHKICLSDPSVLKLPIQVINCIRLYIHNEMQRVSFDNFRNRDQELSKNTFKTWWVLSTLAQEYMQILSEVIGLSEQLSRGKC